jgi:CRP-like cAMP-binding protein
MHRLRQLLGWSAMRNFHHASSSLVQVFSRRTALSPAAVATLEDVCGEAELRRGGDCLVRPGEASRALFMVSGWAAEERVLSDGRRQILRLILPGDISGLRDQPTRSGVSALTEVIFADVGALRSLVMAGRVEPAIAVLWLGFAAQQEARLLDHLTRLGRLSALERTAHFLLELYERLSHAGLAHGLVMPMPLTQEQLADHLGLSIVHLNRVLQQLKRDRLIESRPRQIVFRDLTGLAQLCDYALDAQILGRQSRPIQRPGLVAVRV